MFQNNKLQSSSQNTVKALRNTALAAALFATFQSCENATWSATYNTSIKDSTENTIARYNDADIDTFETYLPYAEQWNQAIPAITPEEYNWIEQQFSHNTLRADSLDNNPVMDSVEYIALHSTGDMFWTKEQGAVNYLKNKGKIHFLIKRDGTILQFLPTINNNLVQIDHLGKEENEKSNASWNHDPNVTFKTIGIEVATYSYQQWTTAQYTTIKKLLGYLGEKYHLTQKNILSHTMVAYSKEYGMIRKYDPFGIDWSKLWLPPASAQINRDVVSWDIAPNLLSLYQRLRKTRTWSNKVPMNHQQAIQYLQDHYDWLNNSIALHRQRNNWLINFNAQRSNDSQARMTIDELDQAMQHYTPPRKIIYKKKWTNMVHRKKKRR